MQQRPNLLFIMADQFRHDYTGCAGACWVSTPNIDLVAASGMRFTQCVSNAPVCTPARIGLATGIDPWRLGALDNNCHVPSATVTYYQRLRDSGYRVGVVGKLDLAKPYEYNGREGRRPLTYSWGFTDPIEIEGKMHAGRRLEPLGPYGFYLKQKGLYELFHNDYGRRGREGWVTSCHDSVLPADDFADNYVGRRAVQWLEGITDEYPWHLFVSFPGPHDPYDPPASYADQFRNADMPDPITNQNELTVAWHQRRRHTIGPDKIRETRRQYCASIKVIDDAVGELMAVLDKRGLRENTIIIFASDHGEMLGDHGLYTKSVPFESALRVPLIVAGPGITPASTSDSLVELDDLNPTICELAGLEPQHRIDAASFTAVLRDGAHEHRSSQAAALRNFRMVRTAKYKLVDNYNDTRELYDLQNDPDELNNICGTNRELEREMLSVLRSRFTEPSDARTRSL